MVKKQSELAVSTRRSVSGVIYGGVVLFFLKKLQVTSGLFHFPSLFGTAE